MVEAGPRVGSGELLADRRGVVCGVETNGVALEDAGEIIGEGLGGGDEVKVEGGEVVEFGKGDRLVAAC